MLVVRATRHRVGEHNERTYLVKTGARGFTDDRLRLCCVLKYAKIKRLNKDADNELIHLGEPFLAPRLSLERPQGPPCKTGKRSNKTPLRPKAILKTVEQ